MAVLVLNRSVYLSASCQEHNVGIDGVTEEDRMQALVRDVASILAKTSLTVYLNKPEWTLAQVVADSNSKKPDLHLALHSNSGKGLASGTETWCYGVVGTKSAEFGVLLQISLVGVLGLPDRGIKDGTVPGNRLAEIVQVKATSALTEIFFHDSARDVARFKERRQAVVEAVAREVCGWLDVEYPKVVEAITTQAPWVPDKAKIHVGSTTVEGVMIDEKVYAPVRALLDAMERRLTWDDATKTVTII